MAARGLLSITFAVCALLSGPATARAHPTPAPEVLRDLRHHHHAGARWRVTTDDARYDVHVRVIDEMGLAGVTTTHKTTPAPERIAWGSIARIDVVKSHETRGKITWMILGMSAAFIPLANGYDDTTQPRNYMLAGAAVGYFVGGRIGAANVHEVPLYVAPIEPASPPVAAPAAVRADSAAGVLQSGAALATTLDSAATDSAAAVMRASTPPAAASPAAVATLTPTSAPVVTPEIEKACRRISANDLLRIDGSFGTFHGYASTVDASALSGLRAETRYPSVRSPGSLSWQQIDRIDVRGSNVGRGALTGGLYLGLTAGLLGAALGAALSEDGAGAAEGGLAAFGVGAAVGSLLGAAIGATTSAWHLVYHR